MNSSLSLFAISLINTNSSILISPHWFLTTSKINVSSSFRSPTNSTPFQMNTFLTNSSFLQRTHKLSSPRSSKSKIPKGSLKFGYKNNIGLLVFNAAKSSFKSSVSTRSTKLGTPLLSASIGSKMGT